LAAVASWLTAVVLRSPRIALLVGGLLAAALAWLAITSSDELVHPTSAPSGSESAEAREILELELGYDPVAVLTVLLRPGAAPVSAASSEVAVETVIAQIEAIEGVGAVRLEQRFEAATSSLLRVHAESGIDAKALVELSSTLEQEVDAGALEADFAGGVTVSDGLEDELRDQAPELLLLALPVLALLLIFGLGLRTGLTALIVAIATGAAAVAVLRLVHVADAQAAVAVPLAGFLGVVLGIESAVGLVRRYREESAVLGAGEESLEYSLEVVARGIVPGAIAVSAVALASWLIVPLELVDSLSVAVIAAALVAVLLAPPLIVAALAWGGERERGEALPLVAENDAATGASSGFRFLLGLGRGPTRALAVVGIGTLALALALLTKPEMDAVGVGAGELEADSPALVAADRLSGSFGAGAGAPLIVAATAPAGAPTLELFRHELSLLDLVESVGEAEAAGEGSFLEATLIARPGSSGAQAGVDAVRSAELYPQGSLLGGQDAELVDGSEKLAEALPISGLVGLGLVALILFLAFRSAQGPALALSATVAPLAGVAALWLIFGEGRLTGLLDYEPLGGPHLAAYAIVALALASIAVFRAATLAGALREERLLGGGAAGSLARSTLLTLTPAAITTACAITLAAVWLGSDVLVAKEVAAGLIAGLVVDLVAVRLLLAPAIARISG